ncbi:Uncharacterised protein [Legionella lansingensis]|uniref:Uncharacterized protein n=1 Tax=Legionella lansingensis TaxID=45067 RepID=A0A0W0VFE4_9GAMM|nr:hypothetical protein [Legionella lansingensis]KTD18810.1 hypothetical protein Llan_2413 [Legionella lansingensis]SNV43278.1 Uncharacterised protein [Legionella lansingensis]
MKRIITHLLCLFLLGFSTVNSAERIIIVRPPVVLQPHGEYYSFPNSYDSTLSAYHLVFVGGTYRVCHLVREPFLANLDMLRIRVELNEQKFYLHCYAYDPRYFEIDF